MSKNKTFNKFITESDLKKGACCPIPKTDDGVTTLNFLEKVYLQDSDTLNFEGEGTSSNPLTGQVQVSTDTRSSSLFGSDATGLFLNSPKLRDATYPNEVFMYELPRGVLADGLDTSITKNGAMTTATITKAGDYDRIAVTGGDNTSYFTFGRQFTLANYIIRVRVKINSLGTTPLIGVRNIWPGSTYSNFNNPQLLAYANPATGAITASLNGLVNQQNYNGTLGAFAANDIVEFTVESNYLRDTKITIAKLNNVTGEVSSYYSKKTTIGSEDTVKHSYYSVILADGDYTVLDVSVNFLGAHRPKILTVGDSLSVGARILEPSCPTSKFKAKQPYQASNMGAGSTLMKGMLATLWQVLKVKPEYLVISNYLDPIYFGYANPASPNYATWAADFERYRSTIIANGIKPIWFYAQQVPILDSTGTKSPYFASYMATYHPTDILVYWTPSEYTVDGTNFHPNDAAYEILANKIIAAIVADGGIA